MPRRLPPSCRLGTAARTQADRAWRVLRREAYALGLLSVDARLPVVARLCLVGALAYLIWPADLIPDRILGLGQVDDLAAAVMALALLRRLAPEGLVRERRYAACLRLSRRIWAIGSSARGIGKSHGLRQTACPSGAATQQEFPALRRAFR
jgi:uncharacterized membrane protein YkvA (DUF1232 family)